MQLQSKVFHEDLGAIINDLVSVRRRSILKACGSKIMEMPSRSLSHPGQFLLEGNVVLLLSMDYLILDSRKMRIAGSRESRAEW
jgi:hypothetical protein